MDELLTVERAAERAKVHPNTVRNWIKDGMKVEKTGRKIMIPLSELRKRVTWLGEKSE